MGSVVERVFIIHTSGYLLRGRHAAFPSKTSLDGALSPSHVHLIHNLPSLTRFHSATPIVANPETEWVNTKTCESITIFFQHNVLAFAVRRRPEVQAGHRCGQLLQCSGGWPLHRYYIYCPMKLLGCVWEGGCIFPYINFIYVLSRLSIF